MTERHKTVIEVKPEAREFDRELDRLQEKIDRLADTAGSIQIGGGGGETQRLGVLDGQ